MGAVRKKALAGLRRRRLQGAVITAVVVLATAAATIALDTLVEAQAPYEHAFAAANGANLVVDYRAEVPAARLAATASQAPVTDAAGSWPIGTADVAQAGGAKGDSRGLGGGELSGRSDPAGPVDRITVSEGRWWQRPGEIVLSQDWSKLAGGKLGSTIVLRETPVGDGKGGLSTAPGGNRPPSVTTPAGAALIERALTVVGIASSISTPDVFGWLSPDDLIALTPHQAPEQEMLYRVSPSATTNDLATALATITAGLPSGAVASSRTYLAQKASVDRTASLFVPILLAFSVFALLAAAFIIANVVSGIVLSSYREIGVMKAIGFTPGQVTWTLLVQILVPVALGAVIGVAIGSVLSQPVVADAARSFGLPTAFSLSVPVVGTVLVAAFATAIVAAIAPAVRAGHLSAVRAITRGTTPSSSPDGGRLRRTALDLPLAAPVRIGLAASVAHPLRAGMTLGALTVGVSALVFALGLDGSLVRVASQLERDRPSPIRVVTFEGAGKAGGPQLVGPGDDSQAVVPPAAQAVDAAIAATPGTGRSVAIGQTVVTVPGLLGAIPFVGYRGDAGWIGYELIRGRWFARSGEAVAPTNLFATAGLHLGDAVTMTVDGRTMSVTLVGEIFDQAPENQDDLVLRGTFADLVALDPGVEPSRWEVQPAAGVDHQDYAAAITASIGPGAFVDIVSNSRFDEGFLLFEGVISTLGLVLIVISLGGVFNTVLLETRQRVRETAVLKTIGMTHRQVVAMVIASIAPIGVVAGILGVPLGLAFQRIVLGLMGQAASNTGVPESAFDVFPVVALVVLGLAGLAIGALGAWVPAQRAARAPIVETLQAE